MWTERFWGSGGTGDSVSRLFCPLPSHFPSSWRGLSPSTFRLRPAHNLGKLRLWTNWAPEAHSSKNGWLWSIPIFVVRPTYLLLSPLVESWHLLAVFFTLAHSLLPPSIPQLIFHLLTDSLWIPFYIFSWGTTWTQSMVCPNFLSSFQVLAHYLMELLQCAFLYCKGRKAQKWTSQSPMQPRCWMQIRFYILGAFKWDLKDRSKSFEATSLGKGQVFVQHCSSLHSLAFWVWGDICWGDSSQTPSLAFWGAIHW